MKYGDSIIANRNNIMRKDENGLSPTTSILRPTPSLPYGKIGNGYVEHQSYPIGTGQNLATSNKRPKLSELNNP